MSRQLNLPVRDELVERLERLERFSRRVGLPMAAVLEAVAIPAIEAAEADAQFDEETFAAWEAYQLRGEEVSVEAIDEIFAAAVDRARMVASIGGA